MNPNELQFEKSSNIDPKGIEVKNGKVLVGSEFDPHKNWEDAKALGKATGGDFDKKNHSAQESLRNMQKDLDRRGSATMRVPTREDSS